MKKQPKYNARSEGGYLTVTHWVVGFTEVDDTKELLNGVKR